jgi:hypothetical protein
LVFNLCFASLALASQSYSRDPSAETFSGAVTFTWQKTFTSGAASQKIVVISDGGDPTSGTCYTSDVEHSDAMTLPEDTYTVVYYRDYLSADCSGDSYGSAAFDDGFVVEEVEESATSSLAIDPAVFTGAVVVATGALTDNSAILAYVFGIPLFLILVVVIVSWINSMGKEDEKYKKAVKETEDIMGLKREPGGYYRKRTNTHIVKIRKL